MNNYTLHINIQAGNDQAALLTADAMMKWLQAQPGIKERVEAWDVSDQDDWDAIIHREGSKTVAASEVPPEHWEPSIARRS